MDNKQGYGAFSSSDPSQAPEVAYNTQYSDAPIALPKDSEGLQAKDDPSSNYSSPPHPPYYSSEAARHPSYPEVKVDEETSSGSGNGDWPAGDAQPDAAKRRSKKRKIIILAAVIAILVIAVAIGVGVGVGVSQSSSDNDSASANGGAESAGSESGSTDREAADEDTSATDSATTITPSSTPTTSPTTSSTSSAVTSGATGITAFSCNSGDEVESPDGTEFTLECYNMYSEESEEYYNSTRNIRNLGGKSVVYTMDDCFARCDAWNERSENADSPCRGISYYANLTQSISAFGGNCFLKSSRGVATNPPGFSWDISASAFMSCLEDDDGC